MFRWTTRSLFLLTAGCSLPLATWVLLGRPNNLLALSAAGCFFFGPALYGTSTPTPTSWRSTGNDLTEQQPVLMGIGIVLIAFGILMAFVLYLRATIFAPKSYPWWLILIALASSGWVLGIAGGALARFQSSQLQRHLAQKARDERGSS